MQNQQNFFRIIQLGTNANIYKLDFPTRGINKEHKKHFKPNLVPIVWNNQLNLNDCIRINEIFNPSKFMSELVEIMQEKYDNYYIEISNNELEFRIYRDEEGEDQTEITVKLYRYPDGYILGFNRIQATDNNFLDIKTNVSDLISNMPN